MVTGDLSFYATESLEEAYYLSAILNSRILQKQITIKKSSRHIFKIPFETDIKKFDSNNINHRKLTKLGIEGEIISKLIIQDFLKEKNKLPSKNIYKYTGYEYYWCKNNQKVPVGVFAKT